MYGREIVGMINADLYIKGREAKYLLLNNTRNDFYSQEGQKRVSLPEETALGCNTERMLDDINLAVQLLDQVYQFNRMYWKSVGQARFATHERIPLNGRGDLPILSA